MPHVVVWSVTAAVCAVVSRRGCVKDMVGCCSLERAPAAVDAALQCVIQMAAAPALQVANPLPFAALLCPFDCCLYFPPLCLYAT